MTVPAPGPEPRSREYHHVHLDPCAHGDTDHHAQTRLHDETLAPLRTPES